MQYHMQQYNKQQMRNSAQQNNQNNNNNQHTMHYHVPTFADSLPHHLILYILEYVQFHVFFPPLMKQKQQQKKAASANDNKLISNDDDLNSFTNDDAAPPAAKRLKLHAAAAAQHEAARLNIQQRYYYRVAEAQEQQEAEAEEEEEQESQEQEEEEEDEEDTVLVQTLERQALHHRLLKYLYGKFLRDPTHRICLLYKYLCFNSQFQSRSYLLPYITISHVKGMKFASYIGQDLSKSVVNNNNNNNNNEETSNNSNNNSNTLQQCDEDWVKLIKSPVNRHLEQLECGEVCSVAIQQAIAERQSRQHLSNYTASTGTTTVAKFTKLSFKNLRFLPVPMKFDALLLVGQEQQQEVSAEPNDRTNNNSNNNNINNSLFNALTHLSLHAQLRDAAVLQLVTSFKSLRVLDVARNNFSDETTIAIFKHLSTTLRTLNLSGNRISDNCLQGIGLYAQRLTDLNLSFCMIGVIEAPFFKYLIKQERMLVPALEQEQQQQQEQQLPLLKQQEEPFNSKLPTTTTTMLLTRLVLDNDFIDNIKPQLISQLLLCNRTLRYLSLQTSSMRKLKPMTESEAEAALSQCKLLPYTNGAPVFSSSLRYLNLSGNRFTLDYIEWLFGKGPEIKNTKVDKLNVEPPAHKLEELILSNCGITPDMLKIVAMQVKATLVKLDISNNNLITLDALKNGQVNCKQMTLLRELNISKTSVYANAITVRALFNQTNVKIIK